MKYFIIFSLILLSGQGVWAQDYLRDVPEGHWAAEAVYELVKMGATKGYPDGTFRGKKNISRYEIASFLSKLAKAFNLRQGVDEKLIQELKAETALIKYKRDKAAEETQFSGVIESYAKNAPTAPRGGQINYRLKASLTKNLNPDASLKINLDTMDAGYNNLSPRKLTTELFDFEGRVRLSPLDLRMVIGPGAILHRDSSGIVPFEDRMVFERPYAALEASTRIGQLDLSAAHIARETEVSGRVTLHEIRGKVSYLFNKRLSLTVQPSYYFEINGRRDLRGEISFDFKPNSETRTYLLLGVGSTKDGTSGLHVRGIQELTDLFGWGLNLTLRGDKIGSKYRPDLNKNALYFLNNFDRSILDGTVDLGWKFSKKIANGLTVEEKGNLSLTGSYKYGKDYPGTHLIEQISVIFNLLPRIDLSAFYQCYIVPSGITQYGEAVPDKTTLLGIGLRYEL